MFHTLSLSPRTVRARHGNMHECSHRRGRPAPQRGATFFCACLPSIPLMPSDLAGTNIDGGRWGGGVFGSTTHPASVQPTLPFDSASTCMKLEEQGGWVGARKDEMCPQMLLSVCHC